MVASVSKIVAYEVSINKTNPFLGKKKNDKSRYVITFMLYLRPQILVFLAKKKSIKMKDFALIKFFF